MAVVNLAASLASIPWMTRVLCALLLSFSALLFLLRVFRTEEAVHWFQFSRQDSAIAFPYLVIVPGVSIWYPWTLVTSAFCETTVTEFLISAISLPLAGRYLERVWGPIEFARFTLIVVVASNVIAWFIAFALFVVLRSEVAFYGTQYHGLEALQTAFLVALAQLIPDHQVHIWRLPSVRVRDLPMAYVTFSNVACLLGYTSPFILIQFGWLVSWIYLRFYRYSPETGMRGDPSEAFTFASWFPPFLQVPVTHLSGFLYSIFLRLKLVPDFQHRYEHVLAGDDLEAAVTVDPRAEAERRRAMALKALDQRIRVGSGSSGSGSREGVSRSNSMAGGVSSTTSKATPPAQQQQEQPTVSQVVFEAPISATSASAKATASANEVDVDADWPSSEEDNNRDDNKKKSAKGAKADQQLRGAGGGIEEDSGDIGVSR